MENMHDIFKEKVLEKLEIKNDDVEKWYKELKNKAPNISNRAKSVASKSLTLKSTTRHGATYSMSCVIKIHPPSGWFFICGHSPLFFAVRQTH